MNDRPTVAVLMGGPSEEHDVSLRSGRGITEALRRRHRAAESVIIPRTLTAGEACEFTARVLRDIRADAVFIALHGLFGEDGTVQQVCEDLHVPYTGSDVSASRLGMDKVASKERFEDAGLSVPRWQMLEAARNGAPRGLRRLRYPVVIKPVGQGSSVGISIVRQPEDLEGAVQLAGRYGPQVLVEEFVAGRELTVGILGDEPLPVIEICPHRTFFDYTAKYTPGETDYLVPAPLAPPLAHRIQTAALAAHRALGCRHLSRVDLILDPQETPVILEVNTIPGFTPTSLLPKAAASIGLSYDDLCERLLLLAAPRARGTVERALMEPLHLSSAVSHSVRPAP